MGHTSEFDFWAQKHYPEVPLYPGTGIVLSVLQESGLVEARIKKQFQARFILSIPDKTVLHPYYKVGYVFLMVGVSMLPHAEFGRNDHREDALHFIEYKFACDALVVWPVSVLTSYKMISSLMYDNGQGCNAKLVIFW